MEKYNLVFSTDENYIEYLSVALYSLLENNKDLYFNIYVINGGIEKEVFKKIESITNKYNCNINNIEINDDIFDKLVQNHHFAKANYYRLLIPEFIHCDKILYLDADIVVNGSIKDLYDENINDYFIASVENPGFNRHNELNMEEDSRYFNSGVMLINLAKWRSEKLQENVIDFVKNNSEVIKFVDQCGLNSIINGRWKRLPLKFNQQTVIFEQGFSGKYNCFSSIDLEEAKASPVIIHYTGSSKPWQFSNKHPYKKLYWKYLSQTPFKRYFPEDLTAINVLKSVIPKSLKELIKGIKLTY